jgi:hypothetical protein
VFTWKSFTGTEFSLKRGRNCLPEPGKPTEDIWFGKRRYLVWKKKIFGLEKEDIWFGKRVANLII